MVERARGEALGLFILLSLAAVLSLLLAPPVPAAEGYETPEQCMQARPLDVPVMDWTCQQFGDGMWTADVASEGGGVPGFAGFLVFAVLWALVPFVIAVKLAADRGESIGGGLLLTFLLGWIGLAIVYFGQRRTRDAVGGLAARATASPREPDAPPPRQAAEQPEDRLRRLERMRRNGLLTAEEYEVRRARILDSL